jgi:SNF2 family DNA or RNA helicase
VPAQSFAPGDVVAVRGRRWNVEETTVFPGCTLLHLAEWGVQHGRAVCKLLHPFDRPVRQKLQPRVQRIPPRRWMEALRAHLNERRAFGQLCSAGAAAIDILPFQLEPALAVTRGLACRVLIADEVGLGKTIQAGLILSELQQRGWCERALIVTPAGLREQWAAELNRRFRIRAAVVDAASLRDKASLLPSGLNPWAVEPVSIASTDFVKQPELLQGLTSLTWDLLIVDEAHQVATAPQRAAAVGSLARRARHVVLLTATPHAGDDAAYQSLCGIGTVGADDPLAFFCRTRREIGAGRRRRVHLLPVSLSSDEMEMHALLNAYAKRVWQIGSVRGDRDLQLVTTILLKRALSSAASLASSIERRLGALAGVTPPPSQPSLPFSEDEDPSDAEPELASPAFDDPADECDALERLLAAAARAMRAEAKIAALTRFLRRVKEPVIVFTEYRDTLFTLERRMATQRRLVLLHGALNRHQRRLAITQFTTGHADLLLATDAGAEGLNLQHRCRLVINLELPWNPVRLEQRIGRVDRLGQARTVHAVHLFAKGTAESSVLARLQHRVGRIRTEADITLEVLHAHQNQPSGRR